MPFLAQFDNSSLRPPDDGIYYGHYCADCGRSAVVYQHT